MREQEMWAVVRRILDRTMKRVILPASLGAGLALSGCGGHRALPPGSDGNVPVRVEAGNPVEDYAAPFPDGNVRPPYAAVFPDAGAPDGNGSALLYGGPFPAPDQGEPNHSDYAAPFPESDAG